MNIVLVFIFVVSAFTPRWTTQTSGVTVRLRGVSAVSEQIAWSSGASSTVLRTTDGGTTWKKLTVTSDTLDFRDVDAIDGQTAYVLSIGNGPDSRIYKTTDAGATWTMQFKSEDKKVFLDAMSFWDADHGIVFGDSVDGQLYILLTNNGGRTWTRVPPSSLPPRARERRRFRGKRNQHRAVWQKSRVDRHRRRSQSARVAYGRSRPHMAGG